MAKFLPDAEMDAALDYIDQANIMHICSAQPANYAGIAAVSLASVAVTPDTDFTKADGTTSGRKVTVAAKNGITVASTGTPSHVVLARTTDSSLRAITTCSVPGGTLTAGNQVNVPAFEIEVRDPS